MKRAWVFQNTKQKGKLGDKCPWSVGWYDPAGRRREKVIGAKTNAERYCRKIEGEMAAGVYGDKKRVKWAEFRKQFADVILPAKSPSTATLYNDSLNAFERIVKPVYMDTINTAAVDTFTAKRSKEPANAPIRRKPGSDKPAKPKAATKKPRTVSPATVNRDLRHIRAALRKAWRWGYLSQPPEVTMLREPQRDPYFVDDATFTKLYDACDTMTRPVDRCYPAPDWWKALLCFAYMTGWRIGEILDLKRSDLDLATGVATVEAESTKGRRTARVELHPVVITHLKAIADFSERVFEWPSHGRTLWDDFAALKVAAGISFPGAFHKFRFGFANANVDNLDADLLQRLMRHQSAATTRHYINMAERTKRSGVAERLHVPTVLRTEAG